MKFIAIAAALIGSLALTTAGDGNGCGTFQECQCLFQDGSHCCVFGTNAKNPVIDSCADYCRGARRLLQDNESEPAHCNADGKFSCVSIINAELRTPCYA